MEPSLTKTYRRADGELVGDDYGWVIGLEWFDDAWDPVEIIEEVWTRASVRTFWHMPEPLGSCSRDPDCDEDAVAWERLSGEWYQVCPAHVVL